MSRKSIWLGIITIALIGVLTFGYFFVLRKPVLYGAVFDPPVAAAEINATNVRGDSFRMSDQGGKVVMLYFGYVNCPVECPLTMAHLKQALGMLGSSARDVQVTMITTDPGRDTPQALGDYLGNFSPTFIGISGDSNDLAKIYQDYGVVVLEGGETHSSFTYVIDRTGNLRLTFVPDSTPEDIAHDLKIILAEN
ncbi:MAG: SCO family protein [Chloroflexota bacterium]